MDYKPYSPEWHKSGTERVVNLKEALDKYFDDYVDVETILKRMDIYDILHSRATEAYEEHLIV